MSADSYRDEPEKHIGKGNEVPENSCIRTLKSKGINSYEITAAPRSSIKS